MNRTAQFLIAFQCVIALCIFALIPLVFTGSDTARLQSLCSQPQTIDLGGKVWRIEAVRIGPGNWTIKNGTIVCLPDTAEDRRYGVFELCKGITWRNVTYPDAPLNIVFENVTFAGCLTDYCDDAEENRARSHEQGMWCAGIIGLNGSRVDSLTVRNCKFRRLAAGVQPAGALKFKCYDCEFEDIAAACIISSVPPGNTAPMLHDVYRINVRNSGSGFDFGGSSIVVTIPVAKVRVSSFINTLGRTKFAGEWTGIVYRSKFIQERLIPCRFAGLSISEADQVLINQCEFRDFLAGGIESSGWQTRPTVTIADSKISGGQMAVNSSAFTHLQNTEIADCVLPYGGATVPASIIDTVIYSPRSAETQATLFSGAAAIVETWNRLHGTAYNPAAWWYVLPEVRAAMNAIGN